MFVTDSSVLLNDCILCQHIVGAKLMKCDDTGLVE